MKALVLIIVLLVCATAVAAAQETMLLVTVSFLPDGNATFDDVHLTFGGIDDQFTRSLDDRIEMVIDGTVRYSTNEPVTFKYQDAPATLPEFTVTKQFPYYGNKGVINVVHDNRVVATFNLSALCNNDGRCDADENGVSCPLDCDVSVKDNVCLPYPDGACDPDCAAGLDPDCGRPQAPPALPYYLLGVLALLILVGAGIVWYAERRR